MSRDSVSTRFSLPFSGDVSQAINPWTWFNQGLAQAGFVNINIGAAGNPAAEQAITENVASYGKQLGILMDTLDILLSKLDVKTLNAPEKAALEQYQQLSIAVAATKLAHGATIDKEDAAGLRRKISTLPSPTKEQQALAEALAKLAA